MCWISFHSNSENVNSFSSSIHFECSTRISIILVDLTVCALFNSKIESHLFWESTRWNSCWLVLHSMLLLLYCNTLDLWNSWWSLLTDHLYCHVLLDLSCCILYYSFFTSSSTPDLPVALQTNLVSFPPSMTCRSRAAVGADLLMYMRQGSGSFPWKKKNCWHFLNLNGS